MSSAHHGLSLAALVLTLAACDPEPIPEPDGGGGGGGGQGCPEIVGTVNHAGTFSGTETWAAASLHAITSDYTVGATGVVTLEPCTQVLIKPNVYFYVNGKVTARGDATHPISFKGDGGRFASIFVRHPGSIDLAYATIEGGGGQPGLTWGANVLVEGAWPLVRPISAEHVTIRDSGGYGIVLRSWAAFSTTSTDLTVTGSGKVSAPYPNPVRMSLNAVGSLPAGQYTGNVTDEIQLIGESPHYQTEIDDTIHDRGVPYHVGGNGSSGELRVGAVGSVPTLTIEPGVIVRLESTAGSPGRVLVGIGNTTGQLIAVGTATSRIVFTVASTTPVAGAWTGVDFSDPVAAGNRMEFTQVEYAGGPGGASSFGCPPLAFNNDDGAIRIFGAPSSGFVKSSIIRSSLGHGIMRGWRGAAIDFLASNTFESVTQCNQIEPKAANGTCPANPSCPK